MTCAPITVCIGTFGDRAHWSPLARDRAMASVRRQTVRAERLVWMHDLDLQQARNNAAGGTHSNWLCFLDADDELDPGYLEAMTAAVAGRDRPALIQPATLGIHPDGREDSSPVVIPPKPLLDGNFMVIGTLIRRDQFERLSGFSNWPVWEDWEMWLRAWYDGADLITAPAAIYRVHVNATGRNSCERALQLQTYSQIRALYQGRRAS